MPKFFTGGPPATDTSAFTVEDIITSYFEIYFASRITENVSECGDAEIFEVIKTFFCGAKDQTEEQFKCAMLSLYGIENDKILLNFYSLIHAAVSTDNNKVLISNLVDMGETEQDVKLKVSTLFQTLTADLFKSLEPKTTVGKLNL